MTYPKALIDNTINFIVKTLKYQEKAKSGKTELYELSGSQKHHATKDLQEIFSPITKRNPHVIIVLHKPNQNPLNETITPPTVFNYLKSANYVFPVNFKIIIEKGRSFYRKDGKEIEIYNHYKSKSEQRAQRKKEISSELNYGLKEQGEIDDNLMSAMRTLSLQKKANIPYVSKELSLEEQYAPPPPALLWDYVQQKISNSSHEKSKFKHVSPFSKLHF